VPLRGEPLRAKSNRQVITAMVRRVDQLSDMGTPGSERMFNLHKACVMALHLADWDAPAALPTLQRQIERCRTLFEKPDTGSTTQILGSYIARMTIARVRGGDDKALLEYSQWLRTVSPSDVGSYFKDIMEPLWRNPHNLHVNTITDWLFNNPASPWMPLLVKRTGSVYWVSDLLRTPLVSVAAFRTHLLRELANTAEAGTAKTDAEGRVSIAINAGWSAQYNPSSDVPQPAPGSEIEFRVCDVYANQLSRLEGTPPCELWWPREKRDAAVAACFAFLRQYGARYEYSPGQEALQDFHDKEPRLTFAPRNGLATPLDVRSGRAIFSLGAAGTARMAQLPDFPIKARWTTLKKYPRQVSFWNSKTNESGVRTDYEQEGQIWQAEEMLVNGQWQRFYGFAGRYEVARVPASEIEVLPENSWWWAPLSNGVDVMVEPPGKTRAGRSFTLTPVALRDALPVSVWLRNRRGTPQAIAAVFKQNEAKPAPHNAMPWIQLFYAPYLATRPTPRHVPADGDWLPVAPLPHHVPAQRQLSRTLQPGEEFKAVSFDLRTLFPITRPGFYRLDVSFPTASGIEGKAAETRFEIVDDDTFIAP
jgi:hypothetical protein